MTVFKALGILEAAVLECKKRDIDTPENLFKDENWQSCREAHPSNKRVKRTRDTLASGRVK